MPHIKESPENSKRIDTVPGITEVDKSPEFTEALKRVEGFYYSDLIAKDTDSKRGRRVTRESLMKGDPRDLDALRYLRDYGKERVPNKIYDFVFEVVQ